MKFHVSAMSCGHCTAAISREIKAMDAQAELTADLQSGTVDVVTKRSDTEVISAIKRAGYDATPLLQTGPTA